MDELRRKEGHYLGENIVDEPHRRILAGAEDILIACPSAEHFVRAAGTAEFGIGSEGSHHVRRQVDLRNDFYMTVSGIADDVADLILSVETFDGD